MTDRVRTGHGTMFVNITFDEQGHPFEVFANLGKSGSSDSGYLEAIARLSSMALRAGIDPSQIVDQLKGLPMFLFGMGNPREISTRRSCLALSRHLVEDGAASNVIENVASSAQLGFFLPQEGG
ncbi:MAG: hypothetical protein CM1200mP3_14080 [Chloroflexota bacterium]|nr:MAG: hypothetical protein CM1200mP3_14080 [Chloroflexota bacterium]